MSTQTLPVGPDAFAALVGLRERLQQAPHGERRALVEAHARTLGRTASTVYGWLREHAGYDAGRRRRADAGTSRLADDALDLLGAMRREGLRQNGKQTLPIGVAMNVADTNGHDITVSASQVARLLRRRHLDTAALAHARVTGELRSEHPNHVHQIDPSLCLLYYMGRQQHLMTEQKFYKNKQDNYAKVKLKVWRYVRYDHFSGVIDVRYFEAAGENQSVLFEFLLWTWGLQDGRVNHGVPKLLLWDKGSANTSHGIQRLLDALGVRHETHTAGHAWAKGGVEVGNNLVETQFESRLRLEPVDDVHALNAAAMAWARDYNANRIKHVDSRLVRASGEPLVRDDLWGLILRTPGALVELPSRAVCEWFMAGHEQTRRVNNLQLSFAHPEIGQRATYDLRPWAEHLYNRQRVVVTPLLLRDGLLRVEVPQAGAEPLVVEVAPMREFDAAGRRLSAQMIGEGYLHMPKTAGEHAVRHLAEVAYGAGTTTDEAEALREKSARPFAHLNDGQGLVAHSQLGTEAAATRLLPTAAALDTAAVRAAGRAVREVQTEPLTHVEAAKQLRGMVGSAWTPEHYGWLVQRHPQGVPPEALATIAAEIAAGPAGARKLVPLRAVGGA